MTIHRIDLAKEDIFPAARRLLAAGASPTDLLKAYRGKQLCLSGIVGKLAAWHVQENKHGAPSLQFVRYREPTEEDRVRLRAYTASRTAARRSETPETGLD